MQLFITFAHYRNVMHFVHPHLLWWLLAMAIPVIVHLFNFRRHRTLLFSDVRLLKNLQQETNKQRKLKHLLILLARMLAIAALVLAFARPYLKPEGAPDEGLKHISVYLDNSLSMQLRSDRMSVLDELRNQAFSLPDAFRMDDKFRLVSNDFLPQHLLFMSGGEFQQELQQVRSNAAGVNLGQVLQRIQLRSDDMDRSSHFAYLLSDFQRSNLILEKLTADTNLRLFLVQGRPAQQSNISLDTCWLDNPVLLPNQPVVFNVILANWSNANAEAIPVSLSVNGVQKAATTIDIAAQQKTSLILQYVPESAGHYQAVVSIVDDPVTFDDELFLTFEVRQAIPVLEIYETRPNPYLNLLFSDDSYIDYHTAQRLRLDAQMLESYETIILSGLDDINTGLARSLGNFVANGGNLIIFPSLNSNASTALFASQFGITYSALLDTTRSRVSMIQTEHPLLKGAFGKVADNAELPWVRNGFALSPGQNATAQAPVSMLNGRPLFLSANVGQGLVYAYATALEASWTNLMNNNLFVALMYRSILLSNRKSALYQVIDGPIRIPLRAYTYSDRQRLELRADAQSLRILPEITTQADLSQAIVYPELIRPGFYRLFAGDSLLLHLAVNESRKESVMDFVPVEKVKTMLQEAGYKHVEVIETDERGLGDAVSAKLTGRPVHQYFVWLTLLFLLAEVLIIRFFKR